MTTNNNRFFGIMAFVAVCIVLFFVFILFSGCRATKRAERKLDKSVRLDPMPAIKWCADRYYSVDSINENTAYKPGIPILADNSYELDLDSLFIRVRGETGGIINLNPSTAKIYKNDLPRKITIPCPPSIKIVDTVFTSRFERSINRAENDSLIRHYEGLLKGQQSTISKQEKKIASQSTTIKILGGAAIVGWLLIVLWIVKKVFWR